MEALASISKTIQLDVKPSTIYREEGKCQMIIQSMVEGYRHSDHPYVPQLAVHITVPQKLFKVALLSDDAPICTIDCLAIIYFFYILRVDEYTKPKYVISGGKKIKSTQTQQFSVGDVGFFKDVYIFPRSFPVTILLRRDSDTLKFPHQKNN